MMIIYNVGTAATAGKRRGEQCVVGRLYSIQYKSIFGAPDKVRRNTCEEARPLRLDFQRDEAVWT